MSELGSWQRTFYGQTMFWGSLTLTSALFANLSTVIGFSSSIIGPSEHLWLGYAALLAPLLGAVAVPTLRSKTFRAAALVIILLNAYLLLSWNMTIRGHASSGCTRFAVPADRSFVSYSSRASVTTNRVTCEWNGPDGVTDTTYYAASLLLRGRQTD